MCNTFASLFRIISILHPTIKQLTLKRTQSAFFFTFFEIFFLEIGMTSIWPIMGDLPSQTFSERSLTVSRKSAWTRLGSLMVVICHKRLIKINAGLLIGRKMVNSPVRFHYCIANNYCKIHVGLHSSPKEVHIDFIQFSPWPRVNGLDPRSWWVCQMVFLVICKRTHSKINSGVGGPNRHDGIER